MSEIKIPNFHTHTELCRHAVGMPSDYVKAAKEQGASMLGISDHCPYPETMGYNWDNVRMKVSEIETYINAVNKAKEEADFKVYLGFECEYDKNFAFWYKELREKYGADYLVLGPHWCVDGTERVYIPEIKHDLRLLHKYADQTVEAIGSGLYDFVAHPDLFMMGWHDWDKETESVLKAILDAAVDKGIPLEINGLGIKRGIVDANVGPRYGYPYHEFWEMVAKTNAKVVCNSDAHNPEDVIVCARNSREFASHFGFKVLDTLDKDFNF